MIILYEENGYTKMLVHVEVAETEKDAGVETVGIVKVQNLCVKGKVKAYGKPHIQVDLARPVVLSVPEPPKLAFKEEVKPKTGPRVIPYSISYISSKGIKCGIATYTQFLADAISKHFPTQVYRSIGEADPESLIHVQVEFGVFKEVEQLLNPDLSQNYKIATWHTVFKHPQHYVSYYHAIDREFDAHIVHDILAKKWITNYVSKPVYIIPHGCVVFTPTSKIEARKKLSLPLDAEIAFCFGFAADSKGFNEVLEVANQVAQKHKKFLVIISAARHGVLTLHSQTVLDNLLYYGGHALVLGQYLSEEEINLYASACDLLIFNYKTPPPISSASGALKRVIACGKPVVCSEDTRLLDLVDGHNCLKYPRNNIEEFQRCIELVLDNSDIAEKLGSNIRYYALKLSWENTALKHLKVYEEVMGEHFGKS